MEYFRSILKAVQEWPEAGRQLIAVIVVVIGAIVLFSSWDSVISSRLVPLGEPSFLAEIPASGGLVPIVERTQLPPAFGVAGGSGEETVSPESSVRGPLTGLADTFRGLTGFIGDFEFSLPETNIKESADKALEDLGEFLYQLTR